MFWSIFLPKLFIKRVNTNEIDRKDSHICYSLKELSPYAAKCCGMLIGIKISTHFSHEILLKARFYKTNLFWSIFCHNFWEQGCTLIKLIEKAVQYISYWKKLVPMQRNAAKSRKEKRLVPILAMKYCLKQVLQNLHALKRFLP